MGETRCPACKAVVPNVATEAADQGVAADSSGAGPPPPEGLSLMVDKMIADRDSFQPIDDDVDHLTYAMGGSRGRSFEDTYDDVADLVRPERDQHGNIKVDLKHALIGAVVVAVVAGLVFFYLSYQWSRVSSFSPTVSVVSGI